MRPDSLVQFYIPSNECCWALALTADTARILSIPMDREGYQVYDEVRVELRDKKLYATERLKISGSIVHSVDGPEATFEQSEALTRHCAEAALHIEVWSTFIEPVDRAPPSLSAGLVIPSEMDALEAYLRLRRASQQAGVIVSAPTLAAAAGDEVGVARDKRLLRLLGRAA